MVAIFVCDVLEIMIRLVAAGDQFVAVAAVPHIHTPHSIYAGDAASHAKTCIAENTKTTKTARKQPSNVLWAALPGFTTAQACTM